jgi:hypothetical protein
VPISPETNFFELIDDRELLGDENNQAVPDIAPLHERHALIC